MLNESCILVGLKIGMPPQTRLAREASEEVGAKYKTAKNQARVSKSLFSKKDINPLQKVAGRARALFNELSLPYDVGFRITPCEKYFEFAEEISAMASEFDTKKMEFLRNYHITLMRAEQELGDLFREGDYPEQSELDDKIYLTIESRVLPPVTAFDDLVGITPEDIEELKKQAVASQQAKIEDALKDLFKRIFKSLDRAAVKLASKDSTFRDSLVGNIEAALDAAESMNLTGNPDLISLTDEVRHILAGITPNTLRHDKELRAKTATETKELVDRMGEFF